MGGWGEFIAAFAAFFASHVIPMRPAIRSRLMARMGVRGYFMGFSALSVAVLIWLIIAAHGAPYVEILPPWRIWRWAPVLVMPFVVALVVAGMMRVNPLSFGGVGRRPFDPADPGILGFTRHPMLIALLLWSVAHLLANGDLAHVILFGMFAGFAVMGMALTDRRKRRDLGAEAWADLARNTGWFSPSRLAGLRPDPRATLLVLLTFAVLLWLHPLVIGVSPLP
ncbi:NnrU family protein [Pontibaca methylaminivorans]|uniref:Uncharacterized membrane protein n=1 Tax=Pontibaca methylaminivorans TaxID=515897 RepID=A0A1R3WV58_9RHOB|nr:NnrU family protein [Pontibaca methylaminivorans]SIT81998.1 Uncharacterized membrane protein [Pontibaca methylaminivorans]